MGSEHTAKAFDTDLQELTRLVAEMGGIAERMIVDSVDDEGATCRTKSDAPEIDGNLFIDEGFEGLTPGMIVEVDVDEAGEYDLWGQVAATK